MTIFPSGYRERTPFKNPRNTFASECCGHLSAFKIGDALYEDNIDNSNFGLFRREVKDMSKTKLKDVLSVGLVFKHDYDFGSTTTLKLEVV